MDFWSKIFLSTEQSKLDKKTKIGQNIYFLIIK